MFKAPLSAFVIGHHPGAWSGVSADEQVPQPSNILQFLVLVTEMQHPEIRF